MYKIRVWVVSPLLIYIFYMLYEVATTLPNKNVDFGDKFQFITFRYAGSFCWESDISIHFVCHVNGLLKTGFTV